MFHASSKRTLFGIRGTRIACHTCGYKKKRQVTAAFEQLKPNPLLQYNHFFN